MITNLKPPVQIKQDDVIDIANSRSLLKPASQRLLQPSGRRSVSAGGILSPTQSTNDFYNHRSPSSSVISKDDLDLDTQIDDPEAKIILFETPKSKILQFEDNNSMENESSGRLLGSGKFEIYQLHQKRVSYLQCGKSIVYPILPRLKILKISFNQFLVTLSNPERYWRIIIDTTNDDEITQLESTLKNICSFRNLYIKPEPSLIKLMTPKFQQENEIMRPPIFDIKSNFSTTSITSEMACFQLESDTSTFVECDKQLKNQVSVETIHNNNINKEDEDEDKTDVESLDLAFDEFTKTINDTNNTTHHDSMLEKHTPKAYSSISSTKTSKTVTTTSSSSSIALDLLNIEDSNWMGLEDDTSPSINDSLNMEEIPNTSTPNTQRYISLNLNPKIVKRSERKQNVKKNKIQDVRKSRNFSDSSFYEIQKLQNKLRNEDENKVNPNEFIDLRAIKQKNRLSSFDVYNILRDVDANENDFNEITNNVNNIDNNNDNKEENLSFGGFIRSLF